MKTLKYLVPAAMAFMALASCEDYSNYIDDKDFVIEKDTKLFAVYPIAKSVPADGGTYKLAVTGSEDWTVELVESNSSAPGWCTLDKTSGSGADSVTVTITQSTSFVKNRSVVLEFANGTKTLRHKVMQATLSLGQDEVMINGMIWATKNVGEPGTFVDEIDEVGMLYQFNRKTGYPYKSSVPEFASAFTSYTPSESVWVTSGWAEENDPCPEGWRVPTGQEVVDLIGSATTDVNWVEPSEKNGFSRSGIIAGVDKASLASVTKENIKSLGGVFLPRSGWLTEGGNLDRDWLVTLRTATALDETKGGMWLGNTGYVDAWGWGDGQKKRATMVRCVKKITIED